MHPNITIVIPDPYIPLDEYCRRTDTPQITYNNLILYGKSPIKPRGVQKKGLIEINMAALTVMTLSEFNISLEA